MLNKLKSFLQTEYFLFFLFGFAIFTHALGLYLINVLLFPLFFACILILCDDVKNCFAIILYACFFIPNIVSSPNWLIYGIAISVILASFVYFLFFRIKSLKFPNLKIGNMIFALILSSVAYLFGGIISNFKFLPFVIVLAFCLFSFVIAIVGYNFCNDLYKYLPKLFFLGAVYVCLAMLIENYLNNGSLSLIFKRWSDTVCTQHINVVALFILLGVISAFELSLNSKLCPIYLLFVAFFSLCIITTQSRMILAIDCLSVVILSITTFFRTKNKKLFAFSVFTLAVLGVFYLLFINKNLIDEIISKVFGSKNPEDFSSGRKALWQWCFEKFKTAPVFGIGFITDDIVPTVGQGAEHFVLAHNTPLQWLVSLGVFGSLFMLAYTAIKYFILISKIKYTGLFPLSIILCIALSGITDQAQQMDFFIYLIGILTVVSCEKPTKTIGSLKPSCSNKSISK